MDNRIIGIQLDLRLLDIRHHFQVGGDIGARKRNPGLVPVRVEVCQRLLDDLLGVLALRTEEWALPSTTVYSMSSGFCMIRLPGRVSRCPSPPLLSIGLVGLVPLPRQCGQEKQGRC